MQPRGHAAGHTRSPLDALRLAPPRRACALSRRAATERRAVERCPRKTSADRRAFADAAPTRQVCAIHRCIWKTSDRGALGSPQFLVRVASVAKPCATLRGRAGSDCLHDARGRRLRVVASGAAARGCSVREPEEAAGAVSAPFRPQTWAAHLTGSRLRPFDSHAPPQLTMTRGRLALVLFACAAAAAHGRTLASLSTASESLQTLVAGRASEAAHARALRSVRSPDTLVPKTMEGVCTPGTFKFACSRGISLSEVKAEPGRLQEGAFFLLTPPRPPQDLL